MPLYYLGLSYVSNDQSLEAQRRTGRRVLRELDRRARRSGLSGAGNPPGAEGETGAEEGGGLILTEGGGRPYFADRRADFSISHSRGAAAVSYLGPDPRGRLWRTGCDIQRRQPKRNYREIAARFFQPPEEEFLAAAAETEALRRFYLLWVLKEAYLKVRGLPVFEIRRCPAFIFGEGPQGEYLFSGGRPEGPDLEFHLYETGGPEGYALAVCREIEGRDTPALGGEPSPGPEVRWFSRERPPLKALGKIRAAEETPG
jgi:phosphopantetheinyl transferase